jgi:peptidoglycan/xylan/chitin deacetylase (PgdA/CDA1 family)
MMVMSDTEATVALGFDFDAVSIWLHSFDFLESPTKHSRGMYGAEVGTPRLLDLLDRLETPATWFIPGHTIDSFPEICGEVHDRGYEIQHHGWKHTNPANFETREDEKADVERAIESIRDLTGQKPSGYRSPYWDYSKHTLGIIQELGFEWDSSLMGHDFQPYYVREGWSADPDEPYDPGEETDILEIPVSWHRDDWPPFQFILGADSQGGAPDELQVFEMWERQFDWMYDNVDNGIFALTMHPQVIGQPPRTLYLEELIRHMESKPAVEFKTFDEIAAERT